MTASSSVVLTSVRFTVLCLPYSYTAIKSNMYPGIKSGMHV